MAKPEELPRDRAKGGHSRAVAGAVSMVAEGKCKEQSSFEAEE